VIFSQAQALALVELLGVE